MLSESDRGRPGCGEAAASGLGSEKLVLKRGDKTRHHSLNFGTHSGELGTGRDAATATDMVMPVGDHTHAHRMSRRWMNGSTVASRQGCVYLPETQGFGLGLRVLVLRVALRPSGLVLSGAPAAHRGPRPFRPLHGGQDLPGAEGHERGSFGSSS